MCNVCTTAEGLFSLLLSMKLNAQAATPCYFVHAHVEVGLDQLLFEKTIPFF